MYIHSFGGSWFNHPFWRTKFLIETKEDVALVAGSKVPYVVIDEGLGMALADVPAASTNKDQTATPAASQTSLHHAGDGFDIVQHQQDVREAQILVARSKKVVKAVFADARLGRAVDLDSVSDVVDDITKSVAKNNQALLSVVRLKSKDEYTYLHSVAVCTLMVNMARQLGLDDTTVREFGFAGLLHDIGKMGVPDSILNKAGRLTDEEFALIRNHPHYGHDLLIQSPEISDAALDVCLHHHEKIDGRGYPFGKVETEISLAARLGAICDVYDALTSERSYKNAFSAPVALSKMWSWDGHFDRDLLFEFMRSIGIYAPAMLVRLEDNRLAVTMENIRRVSRPRVFAFYDAAAGAPCEPDIIRVDAIADAVRLSGWEHWHDWPFPDWKRLSVRLAKGQAPSPEDLEPRSEAELMPGPPPDIIWAKLPSAAPEAPAAQ